MKAVDWGMRPEARLARYEIPKAFVLVESLPRTPYAKVVKGQLRDLYLDLGRPLS